MKILAIHSNKIFFKEGVSNFYGWLCEQRGRSEEFVELNEKYEGEKKNGPNLLKETYELATGGLTKGELLDHCGHYNEEYFNGEVKEDLKRLGDEYEIIIFTSLPKEMYEHLREENLIAGIFGVEGEMDEDGKISMLAEIKLRNEYAVKEKMEQVGFGGNFTLIPNRYGLLELLIDEMIEVDVEEENVTVIGKETTAIPMSKVSAKQVEDLGDL
ncbi:MAG: hypothetical protein KAS07_04260 [Candidatus Pacebacteria bacterium]|nr:hypothetical protein [Candidatus Paceibacterota bacterium]